MIGSTRIVGFPSTILIPWSLSIIIFIVASSLMFSRAQVPGKLVCERLTLSTPTFPTSFIHDIKPSLETFGGTRQISTVVVL